MGRKIKFPFKFSLSLIILLFYSSCCNTTEPPDPPPPPPPVVEKPVLTLELDDAHCTEAWINLKTEKLTLPAELTFKQFNPAGDSVTQNFILSYEDTLLYIDSLLPNQTYEYQVSCIWQPAADSQKQVSSDLLTVTTMDTTSHNFTFEMITFGGEISSSVLYDVAIIDENNIWAVGEIWIADTSTLGYTKYNAVHWDGNKWELKEILYGGFAVPITSVWAFSENDIWFGIGYLIHWNGLIFREITILDWNTRINKIWGKSSNDLYIVGGEGNIAHYNGTSWAKIESGTTLNINDIWGDFNEKTQEWEILAVASNRQSLDDRELLEINNLNVNKILLEPRVWPLVSIWFKTQQVYYLAGQGIYYKHWFKDEIEWKDIAEGLTTYSTTSIRGNDINDIITVGAFGDFLHFNGVNWKQYQEPYLYNGAYTKVSIKDNLVIAVGGNQISIASEAVILIGRR